MKADLQNTWFYLSSIVIAGWFQACSKSDAATISEDESSIHHHRRNFHHHGHDHDEDRDWNGGRGRHCECHGFGHCIDTVEYDDFSDSTTYNTRWLDLSRAAASVEPEALSSRSFANGRLHIEATPFTISRNFVLDHMKYQAVSMDSFEVPQRGWIEVSADVNAETPGTVANKVYEGRRITEAQQAAVTVDLLDAGNTGIHFAWMISSDRAIALYERAAVGGRCDLDRNFTQIVQEIRVPPGTRNFGIRYVRNTGANGFGDKVGWILDGQVRAEVRNVGIPLGPRHANRATTFPARGAGERLDTRLNSFKIGHGLATLMDEFPFNQCPAIENNSMPRAERIFGQGAIGTWDNFQVRTQDL